ncbi:MAG TPA: hypothetical protein VG733_04390 [Chthoniobacteraceae bacterium]|nr:hypothetical protein [Chthoniobacteraceae bacterium]
MASTQTGLYQGSITEKAWHKLDALAEMEPGGMFIQQDAAAPVIAYYLPWRLYTAITDLPATPAMPSELFVSKDGGKTWAQTSKDGRLTSVYIHPTGVFLSTQETTPPPRVTKLSDLDFAQTSGVFVSKDFGATWNDVSGNLPSKTIFNRFIRDPLHPDKIAVLGYGSGAQLMNETKHKGPDLYEADEGVYQWKEESSESVFDMMDKIHQHEAPWQYGQADQYNIIVNPDLTNFFDPAFLDRDPDIKRELSGPYVFAFQLEMEKTVYTFRRDEPKIIPVKVEFLAQHPKGKLLDEKDEAAFWRIGMVSYGGQGGYEPRSLQSPGRREKTGVTLRGGGLETITLDPAHPYERKIDLAKLHDFSKPGVYRFQLYHTDASQVAWGGSFGSPVIDVTITP